MPSTTRPLSGPTDAEPTPRHSTCPLSLVDFDGRCDGRPVQLGTGSRSDECDSSLKPCRSTATAVADRMTTPVPASRSRPTQVRKPPVAPLCQVISRPFTRRVSHAAPMAPRRPRSWLRGRGQPCPGPNRRGAPARGGPCPRSMPGCRRPGPVLRRSRIGHSNGGNHRLPPSKTAVQQRPQRCVAVNLRGQVSASSGSCGSCPRCGRQPRGLRR